LENSAGSAVLIQAHLACPQCKSALRVTEREYACTACDAKGDIRDDVFLAAPLAPGHYFDGLHEVMQEGNDSPEIRTLCYDQQSKLLTGMIRPGDVVLDIGCGPVIHFDKPKDCVLIGIDPSFESIRANRKLDIRVYGSAVSMPLGAASVDRISLFYSIHHMIGRTVAENRANVSAVLRECARVMRPGGTLVVFDMSPWWPVWQAQKMFWNQARKTLDAKLDMFFWRAGPLQELAEGAFQPKRVETESFHISPLLVFPPVFSVPRLKLPRFLYPFDIKMYKWTF
jgi:ubiquinone/menaquinone biosynthesis C-methylase UbiE